MKATVSVPWAVLNEIVGAVGLGVIARNSDVHYGVNHKYDEIFASIAMDIRAMDGDCPKEVAESLDVDEAV